MARTPLHEIEGVGPANADKLKAAGVTSTEELLAQGATSSGRDRIARESGIGVAVILDWANRVDLTRVPGVGTQYSDLLHAAGVDSPSELAQRNPANLAITVQEVVAARPGIVRRIPFSVSRIPRIRAIAMMSFRSQPERSAAPRTSRTTVLSPTDSADL